MIKGKSVTAIPCDKGVNSNRKVGKHHKTHTSATLTDQQKIDAQRDKALDELVAQAQEFNMGY